MKRIIALLAAMLLALGMMAGPAAADDFEVPWEDPGEDACFGLQNVVNNPGDEVRHDNMNEDTKVKLVVLLGAYAGDNCPNAGPGEWWGGEADHDSWVAPGQR